MARFVLVDARNKTAVQLLKVLPPTYQTPMFLPSWWWANCCTLNTFTECLSGLRPTFC